MRPIFLWVACSFLRVWVSGRSSPPVHAHMLYAVGAAAVLGVGGTLAVLLPLTVLCNRRTSGGVLAGIVVGGLIAVSCAAVLCVSFLLFESRDNPEDHVVDLVLYRVSSRIQATKQWVELIATVPQDTDAIAFLENIEVARPPWVTMSAISRDDGSHVGMTYHGDVRTSYQTTFRPPTPCNLAPPSVVDPTARSPRATVCDAPHILVNTTPPTVVASYDPTRRGWFTSPGLYPDPKFILYSTRISGGVCSAAMSVDGLADGLDVGVVVSGVAILGDGGESHGQSDVVVTAHRTEPPLWLPVVVGAVAAVLFGGMVGGAVWCLLKPLTRLPDGEDIDESDEGKPLVLSKLAEVAVAQTTHSRLVSRFQDAQDLLPHAARLGKDISTMEGLHSRLVTLLCVNVVGFHRFLHTMNSTYLVELQASYIEQTLTEALPLGGVIEDHSGDRITVGFNTVTKLLSHRFAALKCSVALRHHGMKLSMAVAGGPAFCGFIGGGLKKHAVIGPVASLAPSLERVANRWSIRVAVASDLVEDTPFQSRKVGKVLIGGVHEVMVEELLDTSVPENEWMYDTTVNPHATYNAAVEHLWRGEYKAALELAESLAGDGEVLAAAVRDHLEQRGEGVPPPLLSVFL